MHQFLAEQQPRQQAKGFQFHQAVRVELVAYLGSCHFRTIGRRVVCCQDAIMFRSMAGRIATTARSLFTCNSVIQKVLSFLLLTGCAEPQGAALGSATDYGYAADTAEKRAAAVRRFDAAVRLLENLGLQTQSVFNSNEHRELAFVGEGVKGKLALTLPDTDLASITLGK
jgi:hypothetical protein